MLPADRPEFMRVLNGLAAIKSKDITPEALSLWWSAMSRWSIEEFKSAASHLVGACQFMPTPYDFEQLRKAGQPTAGEAWQRVLGGSELDPGSREERAARIVGGQYHIRHANIEKDLPFIARRFREVYEELTEADGVREALPEIVNHGALPDLRNTLKLISR